VEATTTRPVRTACIAALLALLSLPASAGGEEAVPRVVRVEGIDVKYLDTGAPEGTPERTPERTPEGTPDARTILFVHGFCGAASNFEALLGPLASGEGLPCGPSRCVALDLPGCAGSAKPDVPYSVDWFVGFLESFRQALGLGQVVLAGHSMGGQLCLHYAARFPRTVSQLILLAPDGMAGEEGAWLVLTEIGPFVDAGLSLANRSFVEILLRTAVYRNQDLVTPSLVDCYSEGLLTAEGARATAAITRRVIGHDPVDALLPGIGQRTLIVWGKGDRLLDPSWGPRFAALMPDARLELLEDCGHAPMIEKPGETAALIGGFLAGSGGDAARLLQAHQESASLEKGDGTGGLGDDDGQARGEGGEGGGSGVARPQAGRQAHGALLWAQEGTR
jgi:4,5:9,10-diseco-3-hydroxy-5,9,17-trioxoandrosta-1(10),2-diene-4-oate hydrolase